jgi:hypothetical protein
MWPFSTGGVDPALQAAARAAGGVTPAAGPVDAVRAAMGGAAGGGFRAAATRYGVPGAALGFALEAASPGAASQADMEARRQDMQGRRGLDYAGAFIRNLGGAAANTAYEGTVAPVARMGGDFIRGLTGGRGDMGPPSPSESVLAQGRAAQAAAQAEERRPESIMAAAMAAESQRRRSGEGTGGIPGVQVLQQRAPAAPGSGVTLPDFMQSLLAADMSPRDRREARNVLLGRPERQPARPPTGRDVLGYRLNTMFEQQTAALEQALATGRISETQYQRDRSRLQRHIAAALGANPTNSVVADDMDDGR